MRTIRAEQAFGRAAYAQQAALSRHFAAQLSALNFLSVVEAVHETQASKVFMAGASHASDGTHRRHPSQELYVQEEIYVEL